MIPMSRQNVLLGCAILIVFLICAYRNGYMYFSSLVEQSLHTAIDDAQHKALDLAIADPKYYLNVRDRFGNTPLMNAVIAADVAKVAALVNDPNIDLNALANNPDQDPILSIAGVNAANAIEHNDIDGRNAMEVIRLLAEAGADVNKPNKVGLRPIHACMRIGMSDFSHRMEAVKILVDHGAHINAQAVDGTTMMHISVSFNLPEWVRMLMREFRDVLNLNKKQVYSLDRSVPNAYTNPNDWNKTNAYTPLELARILGKVGVDSVEEALLDPDRRKKGTNFLVSSNEVSTYPPPLGNDYNVTARDDKGRNPLMLAMLRGDIPFAQKMMDEMKRKGVDINQKSKDGKTTLMYAVISDEPVDFVRIVLGDSGVSASINDRDSAQNTALLLTTFIDKPSDRIEVASMLKAKGADMEAKDGKGRDLRERARRLGDGALVSWVDTNRPKKQTA